MCFSQTTTLFMAIFGLVSSAIAYNKINIYVAFNLFYFSLMEIIQYIGYTVIDDCSNPTNRAMSYLNYIHICFQPFVYLLGMYGLFKKYNTITKVQLNQLYNIILIAGIVGFFLLSRLSPININNDFDYKLTTNNENCIYCGDTCTYTGKKHINFSLPLRTHPIYITPTMFIHFILFFIPLLLFNNTTRLISLFIFASAFIPSIIYKLNPSETGSVWCFISVAQLALVASYLYMKN